MTKDEPPDPVAEFGRLAPEWLLQRVHRTGKLVQHITTACTLQGWTPKQLVAEATRDIDPDGVVNVGGLVTYRIEMAAARRPATAQLRTLPFCSPACAERRGLIEDERGYPIGKCPCRTPPKESTE